MKKVLYFALAACLVVFGLSSTAFAFHDGGVAHCDGCHSMHNSADNLNGGGPNAAAGSITNVSYLTKGTDASSTCLNCHAGSAGYHIASTDGTNLNSGGDFYWMKTTYTYQTHRANTSDAENHGHNIIAADYGFTADSTVTAAPGGSYESTKLGCTSCHDAHGQKLGGTDAGQMPIAASGSYGPTYRKDANGDPTTVEVTEDSAGAAVAIYGNYRLLGDSKYTAGAETDGHAFTKDAPVAVAFNDRAINYGISVAYGSGMSNWCANCHGDYILASSTKHPSTNIGATYASNYNNYVKTGDFTGFGTDANGNPISSFDPLVSIEHGAGVTLDPANQPSATANSQVMCLTCHRSHASAFENAGRWDFGATFLSESAPIISTDLPATAVTYYADGAEVDVVAKYGEYQRSLCNKCHVQD